MKATAMHGLILMAHGARDPNWSAPLEASAARCRELLPGWQVAMAYLEFMAPDLPGCGRTLVEQGCTEVDVLPLFLGAGGHVRKDLPLQVDALRQAHPAVQWRLHAAVGESQLVVEAMAQAALAMTLDPTRLLPDDTTA
jgi:sirohydrochlorin cobaltochelatase